MARQSKGRAGRGHPAFRRPNVRTLRAGSDFSFPPPGPRKEPLTGVKVEPGPFGVRVKRREP